MGKGENAGNQHFLLFPQCFPTKLEAFADDVAEMIISLPDRYKNTVGKGENASTAFKIYLNPFPHNDTF